MNTSPEKQILKLNKNVQKINKNNFNTLFKIYFKRLS